MSWTCHGTNNLEMVDALKRHDIVRTATVEAAMKAVDRGLFCPGDGAYLDSPQSIGFNVTISAPHMHGHCLELLKDVLRPGCRVLDVGSGSGYLTLVFAHLVGSGAGSQVVGVDHVDDLCRRAQQQARKVQWASDMLDAGTLLFLEADGQCGCKQYAPYDCIHVGAAAKQIPAALIEQLAIGGRLLIPVGPENATQSLCLVEKAQDGSVRQTIVMEVMYVPLTTKERQLNRFSCT